MKIPKKIKCNRCEVVITEKGTCNCGNVTLTEDGTFIIKQGMLGVEASDVSPVLLNE
jgi:hypothetical protein